MKTIFTSIILIFSTALLSAQSNKATPNAGFEYWTKYSCSSPYFNPDSSWATINPTLCGLGYISCYKDSSNPHSGHFDAQLLTQNVIIQVAPGALTTGKINTGNQTIDGGIPYTLKPDSMIGWYRYTSVSGDNGDCEFYLFGTTHADTIGKAFFKTPTANVATWTRFTLPITYSAGTPDTALWIFSSSLSATSAKAGSQLFVDDLGLIFNPTTGVNNIADGLNITAGPNPTNGIFSIENNSNAASLVLSLFDVTGRKMNEEKLAAGTNNLNFSGIPAGVYIYSIRNLDNAVVKTGKIVIQK
jgi:type IX secretion system substrate protein